MCIILPLRAAFEQHLLLASASGVPQMNHLAEDVAWGAQVRAPPADGRIFWSHTHTVALTEPVKISTQQTARQSDYDSRAMAGRAALYLQCLPACLPACRNRDRLTAVFEQQG
jgi:hypothetical protein